MPNLIFDALRVEDVAVLPPQMGELRHVLFQMLVYVPIACAIVQLYCWSRYTLHGAYLRQACHACLFLAPTAAQIQSTIRKGSLMQDL